MTGVVVGSAPLGCLAHAERGLPLYAGARQPRERVALLIGPISKVDGHEIRTSQGNSFELSPGCHVVEIGGNIGHYDPHYGGWVAELPHVIYALSMRAGATYSIELELDPQLGEQPTRSSRLHARERDAAGRLQSLTPARGPAEIEACRRAPEAAGATKKAP